MPFLLLTFGEETILNVYSAFGVMRQLFPWLLVKAQVFPREADVQEPLQTRINPFLMGLLVLSRAHKVLHLHLLELARAKDEVTGRDFVTKRFPDLGDTEGKFAPAGVKQVEKVYEDALRGFRT